MRGPAMLSSGFKQRNAVEQRSLSDLCTMRIGGEAELITLNERDDVQVLHDISYRMLGKGANLLIGSGPFTESIVKMGPAFNTLEIEDNSADTGLVRVGAAYDLAKLIGKCIKAGLAGPEGLAGVPATVGGALFMNAGTRTVWMFECVSRVEVLLPDESKPRWLNRDEVPSVYRSCGLPAGTIFLSCEMELQRGDPETLRQQASTLKQAKAASQPLAAHSAGCIFKNPSPEMAAGMVIDQVGLKNTAVGAARVSEIHGNFIVNDGSASVKDVCDLIQLIRKRVWQEREIVLDLEVQTWHCPETLQQHPKEIT